MRSPIFPVELVYGTTRESEPFMVSLYDTTLGQQTEFLRVLAAAGFGREDVSRVIRDPRLAEAMVSAIRRPQSSSIYTPPTWWRTPEQQLARARQLWPGRELPAPPEQFTPRTTSEVLLLHVPDTFDNLWSMVVAPTGYTKRRLPAVKADRANLRLAPNKREFTQPVWLAFDPEHGRGACPVLLWGQDNLAASEVLSALIQFPDWPLAWFKGASAPNLAGYQLKRDGGWLCVPYLHRRDPSFDLLELSACWAVCGACDWSSPSVREC